MRDPKARKPVWPYWVGLVCVALALLGLARVPAFEIWSKPKPPYGAYVGLGPVANVPFISHQDAPPEYPITRELRQKYPRDSFGFRLETGRGFVLDTFTGLVGKDMGATGDTIVSVVLDPEALDRIYKKALAIRIFDYPEPRLPYGSGAEDSHTTGPIYFTIRSGSTTKTYEWDAKFSVHGEHYDDWVRLYSLVGLIMSVGRTSEEYLALPKGKAAYL